MNDTPSSLLERLQKPEDPESWERFVDLFTPLLFGWSRQLGLAPQEAADLVQDVLLLLLRKLPEFRNQPGNSFRRWLRIVLLDKWRKNGPQLLPGNSAGRRALEELAAPDSQTAQDLVEYRSYLLGRVLEMLRPEFPASTWEAFRRYGIRGEDPRQVAAHLQMNVGTVIAAKSRVLTRLRQEFRGILD